MNYAKLSRRFWAYYFDSIIVSGVFSAILMFLKLLGINMSFEGVMEGDFSSLVEFYLIYFLIYLIYEVAFISSSLSSTPGKLILELEVVCSNSSFIKVFIRSLVKTIEMFPGLIIISGFIAVFNDKKQSLHDLSAGTFVTDADNRNQSFENKMNSEELYQEMKKKGIKTFSQQRALAEEMYGKTKKSSAKSFLSSPLIWLVLLGISIVISFIYSNSLASDIQNYLQFK